jgi:competence transcription factor ComK
MKQIVFLEYVFILDEKVGWSSIRDFEMDLADYFRAMDLEAHIIKPIGGQMGRRILYLKKIEDKIPAIAPNPRKTMKYIKEQKEMKKMMRR